MKKTILILILILAAITCRISAEELDYSDWQHILIPAGIHLATSQGLTAAGMNAKTSDSIALALALSLNIAKEYYDYRNNQVSSMTDLQLSLFGIVTSYYINQAINRIAKRY